MRPAPFRRLLGATPEQVDLLVDYGYRAAWRVRAGRFDFMVKADARPGMAAREFANLWHAGRSGVPVAEVVGFLQHPVPSLGLRWIDGVTLRESTSPDAWRNAGTALRMLHEAPLLWRKPEPWGNLTISWLERGIDYLVERCGLTTTERDRAMEAARALQPLLDRIEPTWLHGDCQDAHFLIDPATNEVTAVIDWSDAQPGAVDMDFAVLTINPGAQLAALLDGYGASTALRERLKRTLPLHRAVRAVEAAPWLDAHRYPGVAWPAEAVRALAASAVDP